jgi:hypothetical protein
MREAAAQTLIAKAAAYDRAIEQARELTAKAARERANQSRPQTPGGTTVGPRGGGDADDVRTLQRAVSNARGERAQLMAAVKLQQAKRRGR